MENKLYRSRTDYMLAGVCGGLGEYISIDPNLIRIFFIIITLIDGLGALIYLLLWFIIPRSDDETGATSFGSTSGKYEIRDKAQRMGDEFRQAVRHYNQDTTKFIGIAFICVGVLFFLKEFINIWLPQINSGIIWSSLLILGGSVLLWRTIRK